MARQLCAIGLRMRGRKSSHSSFRMAPQEKESGPPEWKKPLPSFSSTQVVARADPGRCLMKSSSTGTGTHECYHCDWGGSISSQTFLGLIPRCSLKRLSSLGLLTIASAMKMGVDLASGEAPYPPHFRPKAEAAHGCPDLTGPPPHPCSFPKSLQL